MAFCSRCGKQLEDGALFCSGCGARQGQAEVRTVYLTKPKVPGRGFGISSMVLSIIGLVYSWVFVSSVGSFLFVEYTNDMWYYDFWTSLLAMAVVYSSLPILGVVFGCVSKKRGYKNGISTSGLVMGVIGLLVYLLSIAFLIVKI